MRKISALSLLIASLLSLAVLALGCAGAIMAQAQAKKILKELKESHPISRFQMEALSQLVPLKATRGQVLQILGQPMGGEAGTTGRIMGYRTRPVQEGGEVGVLSVFFKGEMYEGYYLMDSDAFQPSANLSRSKPFLEKKTTMQQLHQVLGPPAGIAIWGNKILWSYKFRPPERVAALDIEGLTLAWSINANGEAVYDFIKPEFVWRYEGLTRATRGAHAVQAVKGALTDSGGEERKRQFAQQYELMVEKEVQSYATLTSGEKVKRAEAVLARLVKVSPRTVGNVKLIFLDSENINAFARKKGGRREIILTKGMIQRLKDDNQLAAVISHEIGHFDLQHHMAPLNYLLTLNPSPNFLKWSQTMEHEADVRGADLMVAAGFNPRAAITVLKMLSTNNPPPSKGLMTHPPDVMREALLAWYLGFRWPNLPS